jgi:protein-disulfide isomerase
LASQGGECRLSSQAGSCNPAGEERELSRWGSTAASGANWRAILTPICLIPGQTYVIRHLRRAIAALQLPQLARTDPLKQSSQFDLKRVSQMLSDRIDPQMLSRRNMLYAGAGVVALAVASAWFLSSSGEPTAAKSSRKSGRTTEVSVAELMKPGPFSELQVGQTDAPVTIVEYASMTCGHCANFHNNIYPALKAKYIDTGKVRLIMREFPLDDRATAGSMLARCAGEGKTFPLIAALFARQEDWAFVPKENFVPELSKIARQAGFTEESLRACLNDQELMNKILTVRARAADEFGVNSTPTFFINGKRLAGGSLDDFDKAIEPLLKS